MLSVCASGEPSIPATGNAPPRFRVRYKMSCRSKSLIMILLQKRPLGHRYKISSRRKILYCWDLSLI
jgi:hypothetical protein